MSSPHLARLLLVLLVPAGAAYTLYRNVQFGGPHTVGAASGRLSADLARALDEDLSVARVTTVAQAVAFGLSETDKRLHFGLDHATSLSFGVREREGNCVEYAQLFSTVFNRAAKKAGLAASAFPVHSARATVFGHAVPVKGFADHDWVMVDDRGGGDTLYLDPTFHDAGLGSDLSASLAEAPAPPRLRR